MEKMDWGFRSRCWLCVDRLGFAADPRSALQAGGCDGPDHPPIEQLSLTGRTPPIGGASRHSGPRSP